MRCANWSARLLEVPWLLLKKQPSGQAAPCCLDRQTALGFSLVPVFPPICFTTRSSHIHKHDVPRCALPPRPEPVQGSHQRQPSKVGCSTAAPPAGGRARGCIDAGGRREGSSAGRSLALHCRPARQRPSIPVSPPPGVPPALSAAPSSAPPSRSIWRHHTSQCSRRPVQAAAPERQPS